MTHTVLTIDDHGDTRELIRMTLEYEGYAVLGAEDGASGLAMARRHQPGLILLDVMMPGMNGLSVAQQLIADTQLGQTPIVMLSALAGQKHIDAGLLAGARTYLVKPFSPLALVDLVRRLMDATADSAPATPEATSAGQA
jgi:DNA-binding response OmpR family regulator